MALQGEYAPGKSAWGRDQAERYEASNGAESGTLHGKPVIVLTTVGAVTGRLRKTARDEWWERAVKVWPSYAGFQMRTQREIPVLEPMSSDGSPRKRGS